jgi:hypothetical protein
LSRPLVAAAHVRGDAPVEVDGAAAERENSDSPQERSRTGSPAAALHRETSTAPSPRDSLRDGETMRPGEFDDDDATARRMRVRGWV